LELIVLHLGELVDNPISVALVAPVALEAAVISILQAAEVVGLVVAVEIIVLIILEEKLY
jgi:hypothetical protein